VRRLSVLLVPVLLFAAVVTYESAACRRAAPPAHVKTLDSFLKWQPGSHPAVVRRFGGSDHLVILGPLMGLLPSGPSAYAFDRSGRLIEWTADSGDAPHFQSRWHTVGPRIDVDCDFAVRWIRGEGEG
jgi:hypothetical protein